VADVTDTVGRPHPGVELEIVDERGERVPHGDSRRDPRARARDGERLTSTTRAATAAHFRGGWFQPGRSRFRSRRRARWSCTGRADEVYEPERHQIAAGRDRARARAASRRQVGPSRSDGIGHPRRDPCRGRRACRRCAG
jgi:hypothetical protein